MATDPHSQILEIWLIYAHKALIMTGDYICLDGKRMELQLSVLLQKVNSARNNQLTLTMVRMTLWSYKRNELMMVPLHTWQVLCEGLGCSQVCLTRKFNDYNIGVPVLDYFVCSRFLKNKVLYLNILYFFWDLLPIVCYNFTFFASLINGYLPLHHSP